MHVYTYVCLYEKTYIHTYMHMHAPVRSCLQDGLWQDSQRQAVISWGWRRPHRGTPTPVCACVCELYAYTIFYRYTINGCDFLGMASSSHRCAHTCVCVRERERERERELCLHIQDSL